MQATMVRRWRRFLWCLAIVLLLLPAAECRAAPRSSDGPAVVASVSPLFAQGRRRQRQGQGFLGLPIWAWVSGGAVLFLVVIVAVALSSKKTKKPSESSGGEQTDMVGRYRLLNRVGGIMPVYIRCIDCRLGAVFAEHIDDSALDRVESGIDHVPGYAAPFG